MHSMKLTPQETEYVGKGEEETWRCKQKYPAQSTPFASQYLLLFFFLMKNV